MIYDSHPTPKKGQDRHRKLIGILTSFEDRKDGNQCQKVKKDLNWPDGLIVVFKNIEKLVNRKRNFHKRQN